MTIKFACPNGHSLTGPDELAGKRGKCPECGTSFTIPSPAAAPAAAAPAPSSAPEPTEEDGDMIVFLCPNGHRLHGPRSLEGKAGQCPHCNVRFRIPSHDDPDEDEQGSQILEGESPLAGELAVEGVVAPPSSGSGVGKMPNFNFQFDEPPRIETSGSDKLRGSGLNITSGSATSGPRHPMYELLVRLWEERSRGAFVEIHLADGVIVPERFSKELSRQTHGVFAIKDPDGTHTLTVVPWESVQRLNVRRVSKLPKRMFD